MMRLHICALIPLKSSVMAELWTQLMFNFSCREREGKGGRWRESRKAGDGCKVYVHIMLKLTEC